MMIGGIVILDWEVIIMILWLGNWDSFRNVFMGMFMIYVRVIVVVEIWRDNSVIEMILVDMV